MSRVPHLRLKFSELYRMEIVAFGNVHKVLNPGFRAALITEGKNQADGSDSQCNRFKMPAIMIIKIQMHYSLARTLAAPRSLAAQIAALNALQLCIATA